MHHVLYIETAKQLNIEQGCLAIIDKADNQQLIHPQDVQAIVIENLYCQVSIPALLLCVEQNITLLFCNQKHQPQVYCIDYYRHTELLQKLTEQVNWTKERKRAGWLILLHYKLQHQIDLLTQLQLVADNLQTIIAYQQNLTKPDISEDQINSAEATSAKLYFSELLGKDFKRFANDTINSALNYGYSIIRSMIMVAITVKGLHPSLGIWHHSIRNRFNLADDLIEILRPLVDRKVKSLNIQAQQTFTKEHRQQLLTLLCSTVIWKGKSYSLRTAIDYYVNDFVSFMNQHSDIINPIQIEFYSHEPN